jgi:hypothetical protein
VTLAASTKVSNLVLTQAKGYPAGLDLGRIAGRVTEGWVVWHTPNITAFYNVLPVILL